MNIILLGPPGAGKGTQAKRLQGALGLANIASGDIFRAIRVQNTDLGRRVRAIFDRGDYVPDDLTIDLVFARLDQDDARSGFILDGFPRTGVQAEALDTLLARQIRRLDLALYLTAPTDQLVRRICDRIICPNCNAIYNDTTKPPTMDLMCDICEHALERRTDGDPHVVASRLEIHRQQTLPLVEYYRAHGVLAEIDGSRPMATVNAEVDDAVGAAAGIAR
jgi:adenylate kinase